MNSLEQRTPDQTGPTSVFSFRSDAGRRPLLRFLGPLALLCLPVLLGAARPGPLALAAQSGASDASSPMQNPSFPGARTGRTSGAENDPMGRPQDGQMNLKRTTERQKAIVADTTRLLELAQELKAEVDKSTKDQLSVTVVKKAEDIEKLAKSVKEKMKGF